MEPGAAAVRRVHHAGHQGRAVRAEDRLGGLDLDLELQRRRGQAERLLEPGRRHHHRLDLLHRGHLGQRDDEALGEGACVGQPLEEERQGAQPPPPRRGLEALEPYAGERRRLVTA